MPEKFVEEITFASILHDIGKVGVPDNILLKQGPLTPEELDLHENPYGYRRENARRIFLSGDVDGDIHRHESPRKK